MTLAARAHSELEWPKTWSHGPPFAEDGSMLLESSSNKSRKCLPFPSDAWKVIFHKLIDSSQSTFCHMPSSLSKIKRKEKKNKINIKSEK